ncbi:iron-containing alcohol dehydrogenase [Bremerella sp. P1]|uniref:iron-containing alcohol dehydrogenase n=1 Tax=Bremerella sp. P1 TaxID=3026424 RepID=UPI00236809FA|nr:iron-containing alcohol dehydrogenase [Bremerella sp. P1]WDI44586.1 iron-containing alcohol dehydrogenase [Bremerella sp. P1]
MAQSWSFFSAGQFTFGCGSRHELGKQAARRRYRKVQIVTDATLSGLGMVQPLVEDLAEHGIQVEVFDGSVAEPDLEIAKNAALMAGTFEPDAILGLGGGSNIDLAKVTAVLATHGGEPQDYFGWDNVPSQIIPVIAMPTTAGTGSEVSQSAVLTDRETNMKVSILSQFMRPALAIVDPELTFSCPKQITADSGIDALTHAVEAYLSKESSEIAAEPGEAIPYSGSTPIGELFAEEAIALVGRYLVAAVHEPNNREAREKMALAASLAGLAFSNCGVAVVHALEYPIGGRVHCSHGGGNGLLLPYVMKYNLPQREAKLARIAQLLDPICDYASDMEGALLAIRQVEQLKGLIGIPEKLSAFGVTEDMLPGFADKSFGITRLMNINPRTPTRDDLLQILTEAL